VNLPEVRPGGQDRSEGVSVDVSLGVENETSKNGSYGGALSSGATALAVAICCEVELDKAVPARTKAWV